MIRIPTQKAPSHPGEILLQEFLLPMDLSQRDLADGIGVPYQRVNELVNGRRGITPATALRMLRPPPSHHHETRSGPRATMSPEGGVLASGAQTSRAAGGRLGASGLGGDTPARRGPRAFSPRALAT